ncbi:hypothetical protein LX64_02900 [Chitinophaga skermanii]|uniref:Uncharacterized protein n=1 Tax=Chitinophaga skermanii TaxID=331697 RepID=A0A327QL08_9BACT|nr:hypothetical protein [Chitinophaga skermanii]RAJ04023.1 hypothetical protein LX64_02900 [Chitinophaga skermanii]
MGKVVYFNFSEPAQASFYQTANGFVAVKPRKKAIKWQAPQYEKIRAHRQEFGRAAQSGADLRFAFQATSHLFRDASMYRRLSSQLLQIIQQDTSHVRGERTVENGDVQLLKGFELNENALFRRVCRVQPRTTLDRAKGIAKVDIPSFVPTHELRIPKHATHYKIVTTVQAVDFDKNETTSESIQTIPLVLDDTATMPYSLTVPLPKKEQRHVLVSVGIVFVEILNDKPYSVAGGRYNAMCITHVFPKVGVEATKPVPPVEAPIPLIVEVAVPTKQIKPATTLLQTSSPRPKQLRLPGRKMRGKLYKEAISYNNHGKIASHLLEEQVE